MLITIVGTKGSQGKSTLAHAIAYSKGFGVFTNDIDSSVDEFLSDESVLKLTNDDEVPDIPEDFGAVFDGKAGIDEPVIHSAIKKSNWVLIPTIYGVEEIKRFLRAIRQVENLLGDQKNKIVLVGNSMKRDEFDEVKKLIQDQGLKYPLFYVRNSKYVAELLFIPESIEEKYKKGGLYKYQTKDIREQFNAIFKHLGV